MSGVRWLQEAYARDEVSLEELERRLPEAIEAEDHPERDLMFGPGVAITVDIARVTGSIDLTQGLA